MIVSTPVRVAPGELRERDVAPGRAGPPAAALLERRQRELPAVVRGNRLLGNVAVLL